MSTTFGVEIKNNNGIEDVVEVAFRSNGMRFTNTLAQLLPDETPVIALDNGQQGVHTIGDIKEQIKQTDPKAKYWRTVEIFPLKK
tara:strand:- start:160 stop:414 length:255 start_codon:yes stop_codon:yes gene_type:complete